MSFQAACSRPCGGTPEVHLSSILNALPDPSIIVDRDFRIRAANDAYCQLYSRPVCGRRCYEVSHGAERRCDEVGEECPLLQAIQLGRPVTAVHNHSSLDGSRPVEVSISPLADSDSDSILFLETIKPIASPRNPRTNGAVVGNSAAFRRVLHLTQCAASNDVTVLLTGESGTGKDVIAEKIHRLSPRRDARFVPVECSAISSSLFESELLGHERGSFTGATERRCGLVESSNGGTLFLDEVGDIPLPLQVKLLRLLESKTFRRVGSDRLTQSHFRLICATNRDLPRMVAEGAFRQDLFYRINTFPIALPPLRERENDLFLLINHLRTRYRCGSGCRPDRQAMDLLRSYSFPGNIRELSNILHRACLLCAGGRISPHHLPFEVTQHHSNQTSPDLWIDVVPLRDLENRYLLWAMDRHGQDRGKLATSLGISERTLYRKLRCARRGRIAAAGAMTSPGDVPA